MQNEIPAVTVSHEWQGWVVHDPFMPAQMAIGIFDDLDDAIQAAEEWARDCDMVVRIVR